jgi:hypothetical protein
MIGREVTCMPSNSNGPAEAEEWLGHDQFTEYDRYLVRRLGELGLTRETWNALPEATRGLVDRALDHVYGIEWRLRCLVGTDDALRADPDLQQAGAEEIERMFPSTPEVAGPRSFDAQTLAGIRRPFARYSIGVLTPLLREAKKEAGAKNRNLYANAEWLGLLAGKVEAVLAKQFVLPKTQVDHSILKTLEAETPERVARQIVVRASELGQDDLRRSIPRRRRGRKPHS